MQQLQLFIQEGYETFSLYKRPDQCIDHEGDPEYKEYEESLNGVSCSNLEMKHIGHISWGPLNALGSEAIAHFMPKLVEFAVLGQNDQAKQPFVILFTIVICKGPDDEQFLLLGHKQRLYIFRALLLLKALYHNCFTENLYDKEIDKAIELWEI